MDDRLQRAVVQPDRHHARILELPQCSNSSQINYETLISFQAGDLVGDSGAAAFRGRTHPRLWLLWRRQWRRSVPPVEQKKGAHSDELRPVSLRGEILAGTARGLFRRF